MYMDNNLEFADATSVGTPNSTTVNVGDNVDTDVVRDLGTGEPMFLVVQVTTAIISGGSATVRFKLVTDDSASIAVDGTQTEHATSDSIAVALLVAGWEWIVPLPPEGSIAYEQFMGFQVEEDAGQVLTGGAVNAFLTPNPRSYRAYPDAVNSG